MKSKKMFLCAMLGMLAMVYPGCRIERHGPEVDYGTFTQAAYTHQVELAEIRATNTAFVATMQVETNRLGTMAAEMFGTPQPGE